MRSPALAIGWEFRRRHRWGLIALTAYLVALGTIKVFVVASGQAIRIDTPQTFAFVAVVPMTATFTYFLAVFSFGLSGDLAARQSMYPARMFTLPVTTAALAGWPMLYGSVAMAALWVAARLLVVWPAGFDIPSIWPALLAASLLAWTQALTWMPYGLRGLRVIVTVLWLMTIDTVVMLALHFQAPEAVMVAILAPHPPLAYLAARFAVARARRGDVPDWRRAFARVTATTNDRPKQLRHFTSPVRAHTWFEWRRHGRSLPALIAILLPFELALLWTTDGVFGLVLVILLGVLFTPVFMASLVAATVRKPDPHRSDGYGVTPFIATRPLTDAQLISAKLQATMWSTLVTWLLVLVAVPLALGWSGTWPVVMDGARRLAWGIGTLRTVVLVLLVLVALVSSTWKQLVQSLCIGLTGRERLVKGSVFATLTLLFLVGPLLQWLSSSGRARGALWEALPWILTILVGLKMSAACWAATRLFRGRLLSDRALVAGAACWCVVVLALYGVLVWFWSSPFFPRYVLALVAILATPLARLSAAPLALAWNRHR